jgi:hypothetical protein
LIAAVVWLRRSWPQLSKATKVVSVLGLFMSTFVGAYVFHWFFPGVLNVRAGDASNSSSPNRSRSYAFFACFLRRYGLQRFYLFG